MIQNMSLEMGKLSPVKPLTKNSPLSGQVPAGAPEDRFRDRDAGRYDRVINTQSGTYEEGQSLKNGMNKHNGLHALILSSIPIARINLKSVSGPSPQQSCGVFKTIK